MKNANYKNSNIFRDYSAHNSEREESLSVLKMLHELLNKNKCLQVGIVKNLKIQNMKQK